MTEQNNRMDLALTELLFLKSEVDFEILWRCISKIPIQFGMATNTKEIVTIK